MSTSGLGGGKRSANAELNLVPYIDLLSTLICFLLITAIWQQIDAISTNLPPPPGPSQPNTAPSLPVPPDPNKVDLSLSIYMDRIEAAAGTVKVPIPFVAGDPDYIQVLELLRDWKNRWPERNDVTIHSDSQAPYKHLVGIMDALKEGNFSEIGVNTN
jgi:biopolymer transport protein ExbD